MLVHLLEERRAALPRLGRTHGRHTDLRREWSKQSAITAPDLVDAIGNDSRVLKVHWRPFDLTLVDASGLALVFADLIVQGFLGRPLQISESQGPRPVLGRHASAFGSFLR